MDGGVVLRTPRLDLRLWRQEDIPAYLAMRTRPSVAKHLGPLTSVEEMLARQQALLDKHGHCFWVMERREDGAFIGNCGLKRVDAAGTSLTGEMEIGWSVDEPYWRQGYATEAARAVLGRAFDTHDAPFVVGFTDMGNRPSWLLMERIGMQRRADLDFDDPAYPAELNPTIVYRIDQEHWRRT